MAARASARCNVQRKVNLKAPPASFGVGLCCKLRTNGTRRRGRENPREGVGCVCVAGTEGQERRAEGQKGRKGTGNGKQRRELTRFPPGAGAVLAGDVPAEYIAGAIATGLGEEASCQPGRRTGVVGAELTGLNELTGRKSGARHDRTAQLRLLDAPPPREQHPASLCDRPSPPSPVQSNDIPTDLGCGEPVVELLAVSTETTGRPCDGIFWETEAWVETELGLEMGSVSSVVGTPRGCGSASILGSPAVKSGCSASTASSSENSRDCIGASLTVGVEKFDVSGFDQGRARRGRETRSIRGPTNGNFGWVEPLGWVGSALSKSMFGAVLLRKPA